MPTYEYICTKCEKRFDVFATIAEKDSLKPKCPACGSENTKQSFQSMFFVKGGSGASCSSSCSSGNCASCGK